MLSGALDLWTIVHALAGFLVGAWLVGRARDRGGLALAVIVTTLIFGVWEVLEANVGPGGFGGAETGANLLADLVAGVVGLALWWFVGSRIE